MYCKKCGAMMNDTDTQCPNCKNEVAVQVGNDIAEKEKSKKDCFNLPRSIYRNKYIIGCNSNADAVKRQHR